MYVASKTCAFKNQRSRDKGEFECVLKTKIKIRHTENTPWSVLARDFIPVTCYSALTSRSVSQADRAVVRLAVGDAFGTGFGANTRALRVLLRARHEKARRHEVTSRWVTRHGPALSPPQSYNDDGYALFGPHIFHCVIDTLNVFISVFIRSLRRLVR